MVVQIIQIIKLFYLINALVKINTLFLDLIK